MRIHIIACRIFERELSYLAAASDNQVDLTWVGRGLHNTPEKLCARLIGAVDELYRQMETGELEHTPDAIVLGYGLCSKAVVGIRCREKYRCRRRLVDHLRQKLLRRDRCARHKILHLGFNDRLGCVDHMQRHRMHLCICRQRQLIRAGRV